MTETDADGYVPETIWIPWSSEHHYRPDLYITTTYTGDRAAPYDQPLLDWMGGIERECFE